MSQNPNDVVSKEIEKEAVLLVKFLEDFYRNREIDRLLVEKDYETLKRLKTD